MFDNDFIQIYALAVVLGLLVGIAYKVRDLLG
jgi:hypothetical protein